MTLSLPPRSIAVVLGTRPEIIKLAPIIQHLGPAARVIHTGQHYDSNLSGVFFHAFGLDEPEERLEIGGRSRGSQVGEATAGLDLAFARERPMAVMVQGDTNTTAAAALAANAGEIPLIHVEAGLRSFDRRMPEEHNRVITDHLADLCLAPTQIAAANLAKEAIPPERVRVTGNTVVEAVHRLLPPDRERRKALESFGLEAGRFVLSTLHRPENVDDREVFATVLKQLAELEFPVLLPLHPRSRARAGDFGLGELLDQIMVVEPLEYRIFLGLLAECALAIADSGGVQEEVSVLKRPLIVVRRSTERPEVIGTFAERVEPGGDIGSSAGRILSRVPEVHERLATIPSPYGDGTAAAQSVDAVQTLLGT